MSEVATVSRITHTRKWDAARTPLDVVQLTYDGRAYFWESPAGTYAVGQEVQVNPPARPGANITPAAS